MCLERSVVSAPLYYGLESKRVEIHARIFKLDDQDMSELSRYWTNQSSLVIVVSIMFETHLEAHGQSSFSTPEAGLGRTSASPHTCPT
jgi:hypothetical protein